MDRIYMVRHSETSNNKNGTVQDATSSNMTSQGYLNSKTVALKLSEENVGVVYTSDSKRCTELANRIQRYSKNEVDVVATEMIRTRDQSGIEGMSKKVLADIGLHERYRGLESAVEVYERMKDFKDFMISEYDSNGRTGNAVVVSHGQPIRSLVGVFLELPLEEIWGKYKISNSRVTAFEKNGEGDYILDYLNRPV